MKLNVSRGVIGAISCALMACGGGNVNDEPSVRQRLGGGSASAVDDTQIEMIATFNQPGGIPNYIRPDSFLVDLVAILDREFIPVWVDRCYAVPLPGGAGTINPPMVLTFRVRSADQVRFESLGLRKVNAPLPPALEGSSCPFRWVGKANLRIELFARKTYPQYFYGPPQASDIEIPGWFDYGRYRYTYYPASGNYLGLIGDDIYVHNGRDWNFLYVGNIRDFIPAFVPNPFVSTTPGS